MRYFYIRHVLKALALVEFIGGTYLLSLAIYQLHSNGWSLVFKGAPTAGVAGAAAGMVILSAANGLGLLIGAAGLAFVRKLPFVGHLPLILFWAFIIVTVAM